MIHAPAQALVQARLHNRCAANQTLGDLLSNPIAFHCQGKFTAARFAAGVLGCALMLAPPRTLAQTAGAEPVPPCHGTGGETVRIVSVDPHMAIVVDGGRVLRLRGLRPPPGTAGWPELAAMARGALTGWIEGQAVAAAIEKGPADRWGRLLADMTFAEPGQEQHRSVAGGLLEAGWGLADPETATAACLGQFLKLEDAARQAGLGLWADPHYKPVPATDAAALRARAGQYTLVEGKVLDVRQWRKLTFVNFARRRGEGLSLLATERGLRQFEQSGPPLRDLVGKTVRLRGLLEDRNGPRMRLPVRAAIEILQ